MRIAIAGPPFSGKTAVSRRLAERLELDLVDLDAEVERASGLCIPDIFRSLGEKGFRELEAKALRRTLRRDGLVLALGGGALLDDRGRGDVLRLCTVFTLWAGPEELLARSSEGGRPLAASPAELRRLLSARRDHYLSLPNRVVTTGMSPAEVCDEILRRIPRA